MTLAAGEEKRAAWGVILVGHLGLRAAEGRGRDCLHLDTDTGQIGNR